MSIDMRASQPKPNIRSTVAGRLEIEHIDEQIENNMAVPDFGFDFLFEKADDEDV